MPIMPKVSKTTSNHESKQCCFVIADANCKVSVGKPGFPDAAVMQRKKIVVVVNETVKVR